jgi:cytochrome c oxidase subunit 1
MPLTETRLAKTERYLRRWVTTTHHTDIGIMYIVSGFVFFVMAGVLALIMRVEVAIPGETLVTADTYNSLFTVHGTTMIFLWVIPVLVGFANILVPPLAGAPDMAFPRLNALSYWTFVPAGILIWVGAPAVGWTAYAPLSVYESGTGMDLWLMGMVLVGVSSIAGAVNFLATILMLRAPEVKFENMSLFLWSVVATAAMMILATPVLTSAFILLLLDRNLGTSFFVFTSTGSGDPLLWQHLFWFYSHPAVYIMILPIMGAISVIIPAMARRPIFGYKAIAMSSVAIAALGFGVWAHHMYTTGMDLRLKTFFMIATLVIAVPTGIKVFSWLATLWNGRLSLKTPMLFSLGFIAMFVIGGITGVFQGSIPLDLQVQDTYWLVGHLHYVLFGGTVLGTFATLYFFYPTITGRMYDERLGKIHFWLTFIGFNLAYFVMHIQGLEGMPRRIYDPPSEFIPLTQFSTIGAMILGFSQLILFYNLLRSLKHGPPAPADPWE